jgi:CheY-like chemotaxis protein
LKRQPLAFVYDTVLIPALAMAETHWQLGELNEAKHNFIMQSLKEMIHDRDEARQKVQAEGQIDDPSRVCILSLPARSEADEITAQMLAQVLETRGCLVQAVSASSLAGEVVDLVEQRKPDVVCIAATPPAAVMHARHLARQVRESFPKVNLVVGLWDAQGDLTKSKERIGCGAIVVATLAEAQEQVRLLIFSRTRSSSFLVARIPSGSLRRRPSYSMPQ